MQLTDTFGILALVASNPFKDDRGAHLGISPCAPCTLTGRGLNIADAPQSALKGHAFVNYHKSVVSDNRPTIKATRTFCRASSFSRSSISSPALGDEYAITKQRRRFGQETQGKWMDVVEDEEQMQKMQKIEWTITSTPSVTRHRGSQKLTTRVEESRTLRRPYALNSLLAKFTGRIIFHISVSNWTVSELNRERLLLVLQEAAIGAFIFLRFISPAIVASETVDVELPAELSKEPVSLRDTACEAGTLARVYAPCQDSETFPTEQSDAPLDEQQIARNVQALKNRLRGRVGKRPGKALGRTDAANGRDSVPGSDSESPAAKRKAKNAKVQRKWGDEAPTETDMASLDYSVDSAGGTDASHDLEALVDQTSIGLRTKDGVYEVKDWEFSKDDDSTIADALKPARAKAVPSSGSLGVLGSLFSRLTGSKVLTEQDLKPVLDGMKQHLMKKNVAMEIADKVCEGVGESLVGKKVGGFQTTNAAVRLALSTSLTRILTPKTSTDLLFSIRTKRSSALASTQQRLPYSITFNGLRVLIAACDTFRSGAVEQLRVHVRNLGMLGVNGAADSKGRVELFERGYGKDAAGIAASDLLKLLADCETPESQKLFGLDCLSSCSEYVNFDITGDMVKRFVECLASATDESGLVIFIPIFPCSPHALKQYPMRPCLVIDLESRMVAKDVLLGRKDKQDASAALITGQWR
ncbi:hypothetical protein GGX14DRAFT_671782 [Mycena pura]|uniref:Ras-GAP domain-containing protein n=1 Tax=Mycena pura TaxID=153505 RepID=A0AAD6V0K9_9AGAR|nr:hypothetical protein GGX14DRAFT_671782 [Mycena pura]